MREMGPEAWKQKEKRRLREHEIYRDPYGWPGHWLREASGPQTSGRKSWSFCSCSRQMMFYLKGQILYANATLPEALREVGGRYAEGRSGFLKEPGAFFRGWQSVWRSRETCRFL